METDDTLRGLTGVPGGGHQPDPGPRTREGRLVFLNGTRYELPFITFG